MSTPYNTPQKVTKPPTPSKIKFLKLQLQNDKTILGPSLLGTCDTPLHQIRFEDAVIHDAERDELIERREMCLELPYPERKDSGCGWPVTVDDVQKRVKVDEEETEEEKWCVDTAVQKRREFLWGSKGTGNKETLFSLWR